MFAENAYSEAARKGQLHSFLCTCRATVPVHAGEKSLQKKRKPDLIFPYSVGKWMLKIVECLELTGFKPILNL